MSRNIRIPLRCWRRCPAFGPAGRRPRVSVGGRRAKAPCSGRPAAFFTHVAPRAFEPCARWRRPSSRSMTSTRWRAIFLRPSGSHPMPRLTAHDNDQGGALQMKRKVVTMNDGPRQVVGSAAVTAGDYVFLGGQMAVDPDCGLVPDVQRAPGTNVPTIAARIAVRVYPRTQHQDFAGGRFVIRLRPSHRSVLYSSARGIALPRGARAQDRDWNSPRQHACSD